MGLDMYMLHIKKLTNAEILSINGKHAQELPAGYSYIAKANFDEDPDRLCDLIPFISQVKVKDVLFDHERLLREHRLPPNTEPCLSLNSADKHVWVFENDQTIELTKTQYESYLYETYIDAYVYKARQVAYWRKHYDLADFLQLIRIEARTAEMFAQKQVPTLADVQSWIIENCGYYFLSEEEKQRLTSFLQENKDGDFCESFSNDWQQLLASDEAILYHPWW